MSAAETQTMKPIAGDAPSRRIWAESIGHQKVISARGPL